MKNSTKSYKKCLTDIIIAFIITLGLKINKLIQME